MTRLRPRTVLLVVLALAAAIALATGKAGPPDRAPMVSQPSATPTAAATPAPPRLRRAELDRQDRLTGRQQLGQRQAQQRHRLLDQLPIRLGGARVAVTGIAGDRTRLQLTGDRAGALLAQALTATGDDARRYDVGGTTADAATWPACAATSAGSGGDPVCVAVAYATAAGSYGPSTIRGQQRRRRALAIGPLRGTARRQRPVGDDTQISLPLKAHAVDVAERRARVEVTIATQRRRAGALTRRTAAYTAQLTRTGVGWRVTTFSIDPGRRP